MTAAAAGPASSSASQLQAQRQVEPICQLVEQLLAVVLQQVVLQLVVVLQRVLLQQVVLQVVVLQQVLHQRR